MKTATEGFPMRLTLLMAANAAFLISSTQAWAEKVVQPPEAAQSVPAATVEQPPASTAAPLTKEDVETWLDGFMPHALRQGDVAGAVVIVVKDGAVLAQKGYGYSDVKARKPVDPERTLFRPGSISKLFTWTAVMQLVEQGKLDLDADVNTYLDFKIPDRDGKPVTLRNILTHTAGFEEQAKSIFHVEADGVIPLDEFLKRWTPVRIFPPGEVPAYSNYATSIAGYVVARVSGMTFDDYLDKYLFEPLQMQQSSFRQPLPERLRADMSKGYAAGSLPEMPYEIVGPAPAGSLAASGADMGRFMIAHLQKGQYGASQILEPETAELMHTSALTVLPRVNRMMLGFYETNYNGRRVIAHGGDTQWFHSYLHLFIDDGVGFFISMNSQGKDGAAGAIRSSAFASFADRYLPGPTLDGTLDAKLAAEHARVIAGRYTNSRRMETNFMSAANLVGDVTVIDNGDGTIGVSMLKTPSGTLLRWREIEPFVWRQEDGERLLSAKVENGRVAMFSFDDVSPFMMFMPPSPWKAASWLLPLLMVSLVALLLTTIAWPVSALTRRHYGVSYALSGTDAKAHFAVRAAATAVVVGWLAWIVTFLTMLSDASWVTTKTDGWLHVLQLFTLLAFFGGAAAGLWNALTVWRSGRTTLAKLWAGVLAVSFLAVLWVGLAYHLIGYSVNY
jgi:CubicO group peptidase (beta-lactamase class C family)